MRKMERAHDRGNENRGEKKRNERGVREKKKKEGNSL